MDHNTQCNITPPQVFANSISFPEVTNQPLIATLELLKTLTDVMKATIPISGSVYTDDRVGRHVPIQNLAGHLSETPLPILPQALLPSRLISPISSSLLSRIPPASAFQRVENHCKELSSLSSRSPSCLIRYPDLSNAESSQSSVDSSAACSSQSPNQVSPDLESSSSASPPQFKTVLLQNIQGGVRNRQKWNDHEHGMFRKCLEVWDDEKASRLCPDGSLNVGLCPGIARRIAEVVGTRSESQVCSHAQKYFRRIWRKKKSRS